MSFNFNDPIGVQALLDQIKSSSAWQELSAASAGPSEPPTVLRKEIVTNTAEPAVNNTSGSSVATLLSQLQSPPDVWDSSKSITASSSVHSATNNQEQLPGRTLSRPYVQPEGLTASGQDIRLLDFDESMPLLLRLSRETSFIDEMKKIKQDQDTLERQLWDERQAIHKEYEDKLKAAKTKCASISRHEAEMLVDAHKKELRRFDRDRALPAWDSLVSRQQAKLQRLQVPTMHITSDPSVRELQQRVIQLLTSIMGPSIK
ncbi:hypothetical protein P691DRAFT_756746 [Macrolepiota fuliginosa MF-IS2]|uniref:Uncharacterized protein n=1 Tax=Macrolepiota fuliginosa MF-IS2 TaxID=1400762 RepID=A0A9P5XIE4_9AGAR|nr:hypothetical protein P691DRAFT_756746 [Macrolepiota fuliginosa MF-IS2]